ncbi:MAG: hypothetical protein GXO63_02850 [Candidatus Micrarchaeota archaeon]|nr:hypothetical protein [Candidatus Micrarchaeota archaeon]
MKGFVITLDALLAVLVVSAVLTVYFSIEASYLSSREQYTKTSLFKAAASFLKAGEEVGLFFNCTAAVERGESCKIEPDIPYKGFELLVFDGSKFRSVYRTGETEGYAVRRFLSNSFVFSDGSVRVNSTYFPENLTVEVINPGGVQNVTLIILNSTGYETGWDVKPEFIYGSDAVFVFNISVPDAPWDLYTVKAVNTTTGTEIGRATFSVSKPGMVVMYV